ncbi:hypothetical protein [Mesorhizobium sp.]|uniref:hypothetical protein n=1 Tax=Mesorhizobium sp. TaxID=1871066 RepID=UPI000FE5B6C0|nr:hypothetical protein [Mesorhizobium sp.]RWP48906.1 MAG: hypothetical protein EOR05_12630 [Mesorhizobium sp.]
MEKVLPARSNLAKLGYSNLWGDDDFVITRGRSAQVLDPWALESAVEVDRVEPTQVVRELHDNPPPTTPDQADWTWDLPLLPESLSPVGITTRAANDWTEDCLLRPFEPGAFENPFVITLRPKALENLAAKRARWLVSLLDVSEQHRRRQHIRFFEQLFNSFDHHATYHALTSLALDGRISPDSLVEACRFRLQFLDRQEWWALRSYGGGIIRPVVGTGLMGWRMAVRMVQLCGGSPEEIIDDEWAADWLDLPQDDRLRWRFIDYVEARLSLFAAGVWEQSGADRRTDRTSDWKRSHGLSAASDFARTANLIKLKAPKKEDRVC